MTEMRLLSPISFLLLSKQAALHDVLWTKSLPRAAMAVRATGQGTNSHCISVSNTTAPIRRKGSQHPPKSPPEDSAFGKLYMKLAGKRKMRRVRDTVHGDPGNPFAEEDEVQERPPLPPSKGSEPAMRPGNADRPQLPHAYTDIQYRRPSFHDTFITLAGDYRSGTAQARYQDPGNPFADAEESPDSPEPKSSVADLKLMHAPKAQRRGTPQLIKDNRRSMSVSIALDLPSNHQDADIYVPVRAQWRRESIPGPPPVARTQSERIGGLRDTRYYGFYDDILDSYGTEKRKDRI